MFCLTEKKQLEIVFLRGKQKTKKIILKNIFIPVKRWETRIAAAGALTSILKEVPAFEPSALKEEDVKQGSSEKCDDYRQVNSSCTRNFLRSVLPDIDF